MARRSLRRIVPNGVSAYDRLRELIITGRLPPGARLIEMELAEFLEMSRTPVREAIARLAREGFARPSRASARTQLVVTALTRTDLHELYTIMGSLEGTAARNVVSLDARGRTALAADMKQANRVFETVGRKTPRDFARLFETHNAFHALLVERCATGRLRALLDQVRPHVHRYEYLYAGLVGPDYSATFDEHRAIVSAMRTGSAHRAEQAVRANWLNGAARLSAAVSELPVLADWNEGPWWRGRSTS